MKVPKSMFPRILAVVTSALLTLFLAGCGDDSSTPADAADSPAATPRPSNITGQPTDPAFLQFCAHNNDVQCTTGSYVGPFVALTAGGGHWDATGVPVNGGPVGADGSTGNNLTQEYCARNQDPACPIGTFVGPDAIQNPDGSHTYVACEGTICTNPNHGAGDPPGHWDPNGQPVAGGPVGADGSTGNNLTHDYCARNEDPACPVGTFVASDAIKNPDGSNSYVPCEGTICTNPNHGGGMPNAPSTVGGSDDAGTEQDPAGADDGVIDEAPVVDSDPEFDDSTGDVTEDETN